MNVASCLVVLSSLFIWSITSQTIIKTAKLTPIQTYDQGARVLSSVQDAPPTQNGNEFSWDVNIQSQKGWQFVISVDPTFGFDPYQKSAISITLNGPSAAIGTDELLFGVTNNNANYFSLAIPITPNYKRQARVYPPTCNVLAMGDVAALPQFNRNCDVAGGSCSYWQPTLPLNRPQFPLTITFENDPINRHMNVYAITANFYKTQLTQCPFLSFEAQRGLKVYFAGNRPGDSMVIDSFDIVSQIVTPEPTNFPTLSPSGNPTFSPSLNPTKNPSLHPTVSPSAFPTLTPTQFPTRSPSHNPTRSPTYFPTLSPTKFPTRNPTKSPTANPSRNPSISPTYFPTLSPTKKPTYFPTESPTKQPSTSPTKFPSLSPSKNPTLAPTQNPSGSPTKQPTKSPTNVPTNSPSFFPTMSPSANPSISPTKYPTKTPSTNPTDGPTKDPTFKPTLNPSINPTKFPSLSPSQIPTPSPSGHPSVSPTPKPSINPTKAPTPAPTSIPTQGPSTDPSKHPTLMPTHSPSKNPTMKPTQGPTNPTVNPTRFPTLSPSTNPTAQTPAPTHGPSKDPTFNPTVSPTMSTNGPTKSPSLNPTTSAPSPSPTRAHPPGFQWGAHDQLCPAESGTLNMQCKTPKDVLSDVNGRMICGDQADCCMCDKIQCGFNGQNCDVVRFGSSGAFGVKDIQIAGNPIWKTTGAAIDCHGIEGCRDTAVYGSDIQSITCEGRRACKDALISVIDPKIDFVLDCIGRNSCNGLKIELNITGPPAGYKCNPSLVGSILPFSRISCKADGSCENLQIVVNNEGCEKLVVQTLECMGQTACDYASFEFNGDYEISQCECNGSCRRAQGLTKCFQNRRLMKCADFEECANQNEVLTNPQNDFFFECGGYGSCKNSRFELAFNNDAAKLEPVTFVKGIKLGGEHSGVGTTFLFDNQQEEILTVDRIECSGTESCFNTVFVTGYKVAIGEVDCAYGACAGCLVKTFESDEGIPCDPQQVGVPM